jgi:hypothetical protein
MPDGEKCLKMPKRQSEEVNRRRTDNTLAKNKKNKMTNNDLQNITQKTKEISRKN